MDIFCPPSFFKKIINISLTILHFFLFDFFCRDRKSSKYFKYQEELSCDLKVQRNTFNLFEIDLDMKI